MVLCGKRWIRGCWSYLSFSLSCWNVFSYSFQAAEAQETLEKESLAKVETEVREELAQTLQGDDVS